MTEREAIASQDILPELAERADGRCEQHVHCRRCPHAITSANAQVAFRIPLNDRNLVIFGLAVLIHPRNVLLVCSDACASAVAIDDRDMDRTQELVTAILDDIEKTETLTPEGREAKAKKVIEDTKLLVGLSDPRETYLRFFITHTWSAEQTASFIESLISAFRHAHELVTDINAGDALDDEPELRDRADAYLADFAGVTVR